MGRSDWKKNYLIFNSFFNNTNLCLVKGNGVTMDVCTDQDIVPNLMNQCVEKDISSLSTIQQYPQQPQSPNDIQTESQMDIIDFEEKANKIINEPLTMINMNMIEMRGLDSIY